MQQRRRHAQWVGENRCHARKRLMLGRAFREHETEPVHNLRQAKVIAYLLDRYPVVIDDDDRLVGKLATGALTDDEQREVERDDALLGRFQRGLPFGPGSGGVGGHRTIDFETLLDVGVQGLLARVERKRRTVDFSRPDAVEQANFCDAARLTLDALLRFAGRYHARLVEMRDSGPRRVPRAEWSRLADILVRVPAEPPRSFHEALQAVWFVQFALGFDDASCTGHPDRYLYPFYRRDVDAGLLTREEALCLIEELYLRSNEVYGDWPETIMVGGTDAAGSPVANELTRLFIEAVESVGLVNPNVALCYRDDTPDELLGLCLDKLAKGFSHPAIYNDRVITEGLVAAGLATEDARYYQNSTCVEITPVGTSNVQPALVKLRPVTALECMLNSGRPRLDEQSALRSEVGAEALSRWAERIECGGLATDLGALRDWDAFYAVFKRLFAVTIRDTVVAHLGVAYRLAHDGACPLVSCFVKDCIDRGRDVAAGGARYNYWGTILVGFSTVVDSLCGLREAVFRRRLVTLGELGDILRRDFAGAESLRQFLLNECPKYGCDNDDADRLAVDLYEFARCQLEGYRTCLGGTFHLGLFSGWGGRLDGKRVSLHVSAGAATGATPDGRRAGRPLSENIGPSPGADRRGLTALVNSVTKLDHRHGLGGISVNWRLSRGLLRDAGGRRKVCALICEFMRKGGFEVQINVVDSRTLREAKAHPEAHRTLAVRIAGYSEYFCNIGPRQQDEVIARTEHEEA